VQVRRPAAVLGLVAEPADGLAARDPRAGRQPFGGRAAEVAVERVEGDAVGRLVVEHDDPAPVARRRPPGDVAHDAVERREDRLAGREEDVDAEVQRAPLAGQLGHERVGVVDAPVLQVAAERGLDVRGRRVLAGEVDDRRAVERRAADRAGIGGLEVVPHRARGGDRLVAARRAHPQVLERSGLGPEPVEQRRHARLADQQVVVAGLLAPLALGHAHAHREPHADEVSQQGELARLQRRDLVVAGDEQQDLALGHRERGHRVGARDGEPAGARRPADVAEVDQAGDRRVLVEQDVVLVGVVVDRLGRQRPQRRLHERLEPREHRVGDVVALRAQLARAQHVPRERPVQGGIIEAGERRGTGRPGRIRPRHARHPREHAGDARPGRHAGGTVAGAQHARRRHAGAAGDVLHRGVLQVQPRGIRALGVELEHVAVEREVAIELAGQGARVGAEAEVLAREPGRLLAIR